MKTGRDAAAATTRIVRGSRRRRADDLDIQSSVLALPAFKTTMPAAIENGLCRLHRYADVDFDFLKPLDALCASADAFVGFSHVGAVELNNGFLGAAPGHGLMRALVDGVAAARPPPPDPGLAAVAASGFLDQSLAKLLADADAAWTIERTGPGLLTRVFCEGFLDAPPRTVCLPFPLLYPVANDGGGAATEDSLAVHRWGKSWQTG